MSEADAIAALSELGANAVTFLTAYFSFTFAFLTAVYLVGKSLSKFQCALVSGLYLLTALIFGATGIGYADAWLRLKSREDTILDEVWVFNMGGWVEGLTVIVFCASLACTYFLIDIRREKR
jgi:hypothetical protein